jgi:RhtB (resistance to homoserine/threonine) family protein
VIGQLAAFLGVSVIVIVTPGPDTALTIRNALLGGRASGLATAAGVATGQATWALFTAAGLAALLRASQTAFLAVRIVGAAYLVYLGVEALLAAVRSRRESPGPAALAGDSRRSLPAQAFRQGLLSNLSNPKMVVFFIALLPQFTGRHPAFVIVLSLGLVLCSLTLAWLSAYAVAVAKAGDFLREARIRRLLDGLTGSVLIVLGLRLASERV